jgi:hypothetical protein
MLAQCAATAALQVQQAEAMTALTTAVLTLVVSAAPAAARQARSAADMSAKERIASETAGQKKATNYWFTNKRCTIVAALRACAADRDQPTLAPGLYGAAAYEAMMKLTAKATVNVPLLRIARLRMTHLLGALLTDMQVTGTDDSESLGRERGGGD